MISVQALHFAFMWFSVPNQCLGANQFRVAISSWISILDNLFFEFFSLNLIHVLTNNFNLVWRFTLSCAILSTKKSNSSDAVDGGTAIDFKSIFYSWIAEYFIADSSSCSVAIIHLTIFSHHAIKITTFSFALSICQIRNDVHIIILPIFSII